MATRVHVTFDVRDLEGAPRAGANVNITTRPGGSAATHWSAEEAGSSATTAIVTDANGRVSRWVEPGSYTITVTGAFTTVGRTFDAVRGDGVTLIADDSVDSAEFAEGSVTGAKFANNALTGPKFAGFSVGETDIAADQITNAKVGALAVSNLKLATNAVTTAKIADDQVESAHISSSAVGGSITASEIANNAITEPKVADNAILREHLNIEVVTDDKLAANTITSAHIPDREIISQHLADPVLPLGMVIPYAGSYPPSVFWKVCNGDPLLRSDYPDLFTLIGTTYGAADGTHFNLPDFRGRTLVGVGTLSEVNALGDNEGITTAGHNVYRGPKHGHGLGSFAVASSGAHTHTYSSPIDGGNGPTTGSGPDRIYDGNTIGGTSSNSHTHTVSGIAGDLETYANNDQIMFGTVTFLMKVIPSELGSGGGDS